MSAITQRLSVTKLSQQILEMATSGVYRESVFEALRPLATRKQIQLAIAHAKKFGLHSVADLRDAELGTYYQVDLKTYNSLKPALERAILPDDEPNLVSELIDATATVRLMLAMARGLAIALAFMGIVLLIIGQQQISLGLLSGAVGVAGVWTLQRTVAKKMI